MRTTRPLPRVLRWQSGETEVHWHVKAMPPASLQQDLSTGFKSQPLQLMSCDPDQLCGLSEPFLSAKRGEQVFLPLLPVGCYKSEVTCSSRAAHKT